LERVCLEHERDSFGFGDHEDNIGVQLEIGEA
jgi:hypothetical protein